MKKYVVCFLCAVLMAAAVLPAAEPIFYCSFDGTVVPQIAAGDKTPKLQTDPVFRDGARGKALLIGLDDQKILRGVEYSHKKNLDWEKGTISFWAKPLNWNGHDTGFFVMFFSAWAGDNLFFIYKYFTGEYLYLLRGANPTWLFSFYRLGEWRTGEWHHVVCTWDKVQQSLYIDGELAAENRVYFPLNGMEKKKDFIIGENQRTMRQKNNGRMSLIDEFKIYDRVLSRREIAGMYRKEKPVEILPKGLITVPYGKKSFTGSGFTDRSSDEYAIRQNVYTLSFDDKNLYVTLKEPAGGAKVELTSPAGKKYVIPFKNGKAAAALAGIGLSEKSENWVMNIISGNTDLRGGVRLKLDKNMPAMSFTPPYDLNKNTLGLQVSRTPGVKMIFDRDWARQFGGFRRYSVMLDRPCNYKLDSITAWARAKLIFEKNGREFFRSDWIIRKNQPAAVKFMYTKIKERQLFVAFQGKAEGYAAADFCDVSGQKIIRSEKIAMPQDAMSFYNLLFPIKLKAGNYLIKICHLNKKQQKTLLWEQELRIPPENDPLTAPYIDPDKDKLPPGGWIPVKADADSVKIWGRTMKMDKGVLFSSMLTQGKELLAAPDALRLNGKRLVPLSATVKKIRGNDLESTFEKCVDYGDFKVQSRITVSFDGYAKIKMTLLPQKLLRVRELAYELPMKNERLKLVRDNQALSKTCGLAGDSFTATLDRYPALWIGDYYVGINFTAENLINWHFANRKRHVEMKRCKASADVRFLLISTPLTFKKAREYDFGLTVTPVKPLNRKVMRRRMIHEWQMFDRWHHFGHLDPDNLRKDAPVDGMRDFYSQHRIFPELFHFSAFNFTGPYAPFWTWYAENWQSIKFARTYGVWTGNRPISYCEGCIRDESFRNYKLNMTRDFINRKNNPLMIKGTRNFYYDAPFEWSCTNEKHGCSRWRDSTGKQNYHILVDLFRDKALNIWRMIKRIGKDSHVMYHVEWQKFAPLHSFADAVAGGEGQEQEVASNNGYYDILSPAAFNASFSPYIYSAKTALIPQLRRGLMITAPAKYRTWSESNPVWRKGILHYIGLAVIHDVDIWERTALTIPWRKAQDALGWDEKTEFHPYYAERPALKTTPVSERIVASAYTHSGRLMLAVLNDTDSAQEVSVALDLKKLKVKAGLKGNDVFEPGLKWTLSDKWRGRIGPRGFRLILFK